MKRWFEEGLRRELRGIVHEMGARSLVVIVLGMGKRDEDEENEASVAWCCGR